jgi:hypothetical protein
MIQTGFESRIKIQDIVSNQLPEFVLDESPKAVDFLKQYYISQEYQGGPIDIAENLDQYLKVDNLTPEVIVDSTVITEDITSSDTVISVTSTKGFPNKYGLLKIDDEIITYTGLTSNTFTGCVRGFSGVTNYHHDLNNEELVFTQSEAADHSSGSSIQNLSSLFLKEFYNKIKYTFTPGFENREFDSQINVGNFIKEARSFYESKGTDESFRILFNVLYGEVAKVINLEDYLLKPSDAEFLRREVVVAEVISGDPLKLIGQTLFKSDDTSTKASISAIEAFTRRNVQYFKISLFVGYDDNNSIEGTFKITPNTKCLEDVDIDSSVISVDSTIGFNSFGTIRVGNNTISYTDKNINQFLNCSGITEQILSTSNVFSSTETYFGYEDGDLSKKVELRLTGVLKDFEQKSKFISAEEGQILTVKNLGELIKNPESNKTYKEIFANSWIYNTSASIQIESFDGSGVTLKTDIDRSHFKKGDEVEIVDITTNTVTYPTETSDHPYVSDNIEFGSRIVLLDGFDLTGIVVGNADNYVLRRKINKASSSNVSFEYGNNSLISDVQNVYIDNDGFAYVASNSLPSYDEEGGNFYTYELTQKLNQSILNSSLGQLTDLSSEDTSTDYYTSILFDDPVPFVTGDKIFYQPLQKSLVGLDTGSYYVRVSDTNPKSIKLYTSASFVSSDTNALQFSSSVTPLETHLFTLESQKSRVLGSSNILKKFNFDLIKRGSNQETIPGSTGMLINGVEIFNYKSQDKVYYGPLQSVSVLNGGSNFDVVNPPKIELSPSAGTTALVQPVVTGSITNIFVDTQDFDINQILSVNVTGLNINGGSFQPIITKRRRELLFDARPTTSGGGISTTTAQLTFISNHNLSNGEEIIYGNNGNDDITIGFGSSSLINGAIYYAKVDNSTTIQLFPTFEDYQSSTNVIGFSTEALSGTHQFFVGSEKNTISEIKVLDGGSLTNRKLLVDSSKVSVSENLINFENHGFSNGDIVEYSSDGSIISGLSTTNRYYILTNDINSFRLCDAGIGGTVTSNFEQEKYEKLLSSGSGLQEFKYPDIEVAVEFTTVGVSSLTEVNTVKATPEVKGYISDIYLYNSGTGYGSSIINNELKPIFTIKNGRSGQVEPIILNGKIVDLNLQFNGYDYFSVPDLEIVDPTGSGTGGKLRASISNGKISEVSIINSGIGYSTSTIVNVVSSGSNAIFDSTIRSLSINEVEKLTPNQYQIYRDVNDKLQYFVSGYYSNLRSSFQEDSTASGIIGWSYDGNPIYGSYAISDINDLNSTDKILKSSYTKDSSNIFDRPSELDFPLGFFVEDYKYDSSNGDLDEHNGRFSKTVDFPEGIYAYYATIDSVTGNPQFPYFIGNTYRSNILEENYTLNQDFDFNNSSLVRNTFPYKISEQFADNDFIVETNEIKRQKIEIKSVSEGSISGFDIINSGDNYKVGDTLTFDNEGTDGGGLQASISSIEGKTINDITTTLETYNNSIFVWNKDKVEVYIDPSHQLSSGDFVIISGFSTSILSELNDSYRITVPVSNNIGLTTEIQASGESLEIYVTNVPSSILPGTNIGIGTENLEVLNVFSNKNILRVKRGIPGISHTTGEQISIKPNKFTLNVDLDYFESKFDDKVYFNPNESVGVGTITGVGNEISFSLGDETITRNIPTQRIYLENHPFTTNQLVDFNVNGNGAISISNTPTSTPYDLPSSVYVVNKSPNTIGIKTTISGDEIFFRTNGDNVDDYYFESTFKQELANVKKIVSTISVSTSHGLSDGDTISLTVKPNLSVGIGTSTAVRVLYKSEIENIVVNPIGFNSTGVSTTTNEITITDHGLVTGDKVFYEDNTLLTNSEYFIYKVDENTIKFCDTLKNANSNPPVVVSFASTGSSSQSISLINPQIQTVKNNNLVFDLSDSSLSGYEFKIYYDQEFNNDFVSTGSTASFNISGIGTVGVTSTASLTINYSNNVPQKLYYNLEKSGYISTSDKDVKNYSEIFYADSVYTNSYSIFDVGVTTFRINLSENPEKSSYSSSESDELKYTTTSLSAQGPVNKIKINSKGLGYKKLPNLTSSNSSNGKNLYVIPKTNDIGIINQVRIINQGFEYSSDRTLQPEAFISPSIVLSDSNTIKDITVINGGNGYINPPNIVIVNNDTREVIDTGILSPVLLGNSISEVIISNQPKGISDESAKLFAVNNTNGISIKQVESSSTGIFTCIITTPSGGFSQEPFNNGDEVFIEGIQKYGSSGDGFNSSDYGYEFFVVDNYDNGGGTGDARVTIDISNLTSNTGIAKTIQDSTGTIVNKDNYPSFELTLSPSFFEIGEKIISDGIERDLEIVKYDDTVSIKVFGSYDLSVGEIITGKTTGNIATIESLTSYEGRFEVDFSSRKEEGWSNETGKLNEDYQLLPDNDYYQNLSYSVKSLQQWKDIKTPVNSLVHTSGLKNFSDTQILSDSEDKIGISSFANETTILKDIIDTKRVDTIYNFDFVTDVDVVNNTSRFLKLNSKKLTNYTQIGSNIVLRIDDISDLFSNFDSDPNEYKDLFKINLSETYSNYLFKLKDINGTEVQLTNITVINDNISNNSFILENVSLSNNESNETYADFSIETDQFDDVYLRFIPKDPFDTEYDLKYIQKKVLPGVGLGTTSVGFVDIVSSVSGVSSSSTSTLAQFSSPNVSSLYVKSHIIQENTNDINFVELFVTHDGTNTTVAEYYFDNTPLGRSNNIVGLFTAFIDSGTLFLEFINDTSYTVDVKSRIIGFGNTSVGIGTYRFNLNGQPEGNERSAIYQSNYSSTSSGLSTSILTLDKSKFDSINALIEVGIGNTKSLHNVLLVQDQSNIYTQQSQFLSVGDNLGIGTFGGEYTGPDKFELKFYPDSNSNIKISSFNECLYTEVDAINDYPDLVIENSIESVEYSQYFAINGDRINKVDFVLRTDGIPIFGKRFNPNDTSILNPATGIFSIQDHFFSNDEELIYTPGSTFIGVGASSLVYDNGTGTGSLPSSVFVVNKTNDTFQISTTRSGTPVTFTSLGAGNDHLFEMSKSNEKAIINIDNLTQYPLIYTKVQTSLSGNGGSISSSDEIFALSGISTLNPNDILKINDEYMEVINVGFGTLNTGPITNTGTEKLVQVSRGFVGSSTTSHTDSDIVDVYKGSYNIVGDKIYFTKAPRGNTSIIRTENNLLFETSDFNGRVFLRSDYTTNRVYDDISNEFTGIGRTFTLTVGGANTTGIGSIGDNGVVFINGIFQTPTTDNNPNNNFSILEDGSKTDIVFSGIRTDPGDPNSVLAVENDINQNQVPRGGIIVSLGSSGGLGYAPLAGASVTAIVSAGSIVDLSTNFVGGSYGSGYNGIVSIGVTVFEEGHVGTVATITGVAGIGGTVIFNVVSGGSGYSNPTIIVSEPSYENLEVTGVSRIGVGATTDTGVGLLLDVDVSASTATGIGSTYFEVSNFTIKRSGYSFRKGDVFTPVGLVTDGRLSSPFSRYELTVLDTFSDNFGCWQFGEFDFIDSLKFYQDGERTRFPLLYNGSLLSFEVDEDAEGSIDLSSSLLIFLNGILQEPGVSYNFNGGTSFTFTSAPKEEDNLAVFFYRGTKGVDDILVTNIIPSLERGDTVQVFKNNSIPGTITQDSRVVFDITESDKFETNFYDGSGIDIVNLKPVSWTKQKIDRSINGEFVYKTRQSIISQIYPTAKVIGDLSTSDTEIFVDDADLFGYADSAPYDFGAILVGENNAEPPNITSTIDGNGSVTSLTIVDGGSGYSGSTIDVKFNAPPTIGVGVGTTATATVTVGSDGVLTTPINITNPGFGYSTAPITIVERPNPQIEVITRIQDIKGFSGIVTGIGVTDNAGQLALKFTLKVDGIFNNSPNILQSGYPILIKNTTVGSGVISVNNSDSEVVAIGTNFLDNIYYVSEVSSNGSVGIVTCNIDSSTSTAGLSTNGLYVGEFSWGRLATITRSTSPISIGVTGKTFNVGLSTFPSIQRRDDGLRQTGAIVEKITS